MQGKTVTLNIIWRPVRLYKMDSLKVLHFPQVTANCLQSQRGNFVRLSLTQCQHALAAGTATDPLQAGNHYLQDHDVRSSVVPARPAVSPSIDQEPSFVHRTSAAATSCQDCFRCPGFLRCCSQTLELTVGSH